MNWISQREVGVGPARQFRGKGVCHHSGRPDLVPVIHTVEGESPGLHAWEGRILTNSPPTSTCALWCAHHTTLQYTDV